MLDPHFEIQGLGPALAKLEAVKILPGQKATRFALRKAANLVRDAAKANAQRLDDPRTPESIAENIDVRFDGAYFRRTDDMKMSIGVLGGAKSTSENAKGKRRRRRASGGTTLEDLGEIAGAGSGNPGGDTFYWRFLEFGTEKMAAQPFMRPAMDEAGEPAIAEFVSQFDNALARAIRRASRGQ